ncbi:MAG: beta-phosphoglucomutase [Anaerocolumna sp.]|jgi:beta-phosphoglucomutase|nr:beta-phosphoglucomutase [Anaerocolumna sp.]
MKYKAIIFDLDGVICHTDHYHYLAWKQLAQKLGIYFDEGINNQLRGVSRMDSLNIILKKWEGDPLSEKEKLSLAESKNENYRELLKQMSPKDLNQDIKSTLDKLRNKGVLLGIGSSSKNARYILEQIGIGNYFDAISDGNNIMHSKPHPEVFLTAAKELNISPSDCLVVEDAKSGIEAAKAAGMDSAAVGDAQGFPQTTYDLNNFMDLLEICC